MKYNSNLQFYFLPYILKVVHVKYNIINIIFIIVDMTSNRRQNTTNTGEADTNFSTETSTRVNISYFFPKF